MRYCFSAHRNSRTSSAPLIFKRARHLQRAMKEEREILVQAARLQPAAATSMAHFGMEKRGLGTHYDWPRRACQKLTNAVGSTRTNQSTGPTTSTLHRLLESPESRLAYRSTLVSSVWDPHHPHWSHFTHLTNFYRQHQSHPPSLGFPRTVKSLGGTSHLMRY